jgi:hypothetical protein
MMQLTEFSASDAVTAGSIALSGLSTPSEKSLMFRHYATVHEAIL